MNSLPPKTNPPRLLEANDRLGAFMRRAVNSPEQTTAHRVVGQCIRFEAALVNKPRGQRVIHVYAWAAALAVVAIAGVRFRHDARPWLTAPHAQAVIVPVPSTPGTAEPAESVVDIDEQQMRQLRDGTVVSTFEGGRAKVSYPSSQRTVVQLDRGGVELAVTPRKAGELLEVAAGRYRFRVIGTRFRVEQDKTGLKLSVTEGRVAVVRDEQILQIVEGGSDWFESAPNARAALPQAKHSNPSPTSHARNFGVTQQEDCLAIARAGEHTAALSCFERQAAGSGVAAEVALYESARIEHELMGRTGEALATLNTYRERFPNGSLRLETRLMAVRLLVELGNDSRALSESNELLQSGQAQSRNEELRFLRGKLYQRQGNYAQAASEYAQASVSSNTLSDRARLERAHCLERLGRKEEVRAAYEELSHSSHAHMRKEALRRLERMSGEEALQNAP